MGEACRVGVFVEVSGSPHVGEVGHFEAVGHVAGEADVEHCRPDALVLDDVHDLRHQLARLPCEGAAGLHDEPQVGVAAVEALQNMYKVWDVVVFPRHEVPASEVHPFYARHPLSEFLLYVDECALEDIGPALAVAVAVEAVHEAEQAVAVGREVVGQLAGRHAEAGARGAGVVERRSHLGIFGVDAQAEGEVGVLLPGPRGQPVELRQGVEGEVAGAARHLVDLVVGVGGGIGVGGAAELLFCQPCLPQGAGGGGVDVLAEDGERLPQGKGLEGQNDFDVGLVGHGGYQPQVVA